MRSSTLPRRLTVTYILALVLIGTLTLISDGILLSAVERESSDATVLNMSGKQRMLSQRVALFAGTYAQNGQQADQESLINAANEMLRDHITLIEGDPSRDIDYPASPIARTFYFDPPHRLDERVRAHVQRALTLAAMENPRSEEALALVEAIALEARGPLLQSLDAAVSNYEQEARARVDGFERVNAFVLILLAGTIVGVGVFLFRPMVNRIETFLNERQKREAELKRMSWVVENMADAMILTDKEGLILTCNRTAEELTGYKKNELVGTRVIDLAILETFQEKTDMQSNARQTIEDGGIWRGEFHIKRKDGSTRVFDNITTGLLDEDGNAVGRISINRDVTQRFEVDRMKNEFVSVVSHELRTPLTSIMGSLGLIQSGAVGDVTDDVKGMVDIAFNNSDRLVRLINDILDIEKIEAGRMDFRSDRLDAKQLIGQALEENAGYAQKQNVKLLTDVTEEADLWVRGDRDKINQIFANLISNAVKFSSAGDSVTITLDADEDFVRFSVQDNGTGVPEEFQDKLFERFSQADSSATREQGGTGLGLTICKAIVDRLGGDIGFESKAGQGATFYFTVPKTMSTKPILAEASNSPRALIIEDDPDTATLLRLILRQTGLETDVTFSLRDARRQLESVPYDAITLDLAVDDENGLDLLKEIRAKRIDTPVIVVSGRGSEEEERFEGGAIDVAAWLQKPVDATLLQDTLSQALRGGSGRPSVMHIEDDSDVLRVVDSILKGTADVTSVSTVAEAKSLLKDLTNRFDLILLDLGLPDGRGEELLADLRSNGHSATPVVVFTGHEVNSDDVATSVIAVLEKSRTSNDELKECVMAALNRSAILAKEKQRVLI